jgi:hypothetical protein
MLRAGSAYTYAYATMASDGALLGPQQYIQHGL